MKYIAVPKWLELRTPTTPTPWVRARSTASRAGPLGEHLADAVAAVEQHAAGRCRTRTAGSVTRAHGAGAQPGGVPGQPQEAVRLVAPEVGLHEAVGDQGGVVRPGRRGRRAPARRTSRRVSGAIRARHAGPLLVASCPMLYTVLHTTTREREDGDVQPGGADGGAARTAGGVPRRHGRQRGGVGAGRAGVPAVRRLLGRRPTRTGSSSTSSTPTPTAFEAHKASPHFAQWRTVAERGARRPGQHARRRCWSPTPPRSPHEQPARPAVDGPAARRRSSASTAATASSRSRSSASGTARTTQVTTGHDRLLARHRHPAALAQRRGDRSSSTRARPPPSSATTSSTWSPARPPGCRPASRTASATAARAR